jgi:hypothetical protein
VYNIGARDKGGRKMKKELIEPQKKGEKNKMTLEEIQQLKQLQEAQESYVEDLLERVQNYAAKTNKRDYVATDKERETFRQILIIVNNINNYL